MERAHWTQAASAQHPNAPAVDNRIAADAEGARSCRRKPAAAIPIPPPSELDRISLRSESRPGTTEYWSNSIDTVEATTTRQVVRRRTPASRSPNPNGTNSSTLSPKSDAQCVPQVMQRSKWSAGGPAPGARVRPAMTSTVMTVMAAPSVFCCASATVRRRPNGLLWPSFRAGVPESSRNESIGSGIARAGLAARRWLSRLGTGGGMAAVGPAGYDIDHGLLQGRV